MILTSGVFDPLHAGHYRFLNTIKAKFHQPLWVVVGDDDVRHPSLVPLADRAEIIEHLDCVDRVLPDRTVPGAIREFGPTLFVKGMDWNGKALPDDLQVVLTEENVPFVCVDSVVHRSSSELLADYQRRLNAEKLAAFEQWVRTQPFPKYWAPVTDYSRETRREIEGPHADILAEVFKGCSVLDFGCGFGYLVDLLVERGMQVQGFDVNPERGWSDVPQPADVVICREVLEHIQARNLREEVSRLVAHARRYVYVTTRFTSKPHLLDFDTSDDLDPTHVMMLNQDYLRSLFVLEGCTRCPDLEAKLDHKKLGRVLVYQVPQ